MATKPKLGVPVNPQAIVLTNDNPDDYQGDRWIQPSPKVAPPEAGSGLIRRIAGDGGITALKGAIGVPEAAVGLADLVTGGNVGKALENEGGAFGFRPKEAKAYLDQFYSPEQQAAFRAVQNASDPNAGLIENIGNVGAAALRNPSVIAHSVVESLPVMGAGGVIGRGVLAAAPRAAGWAAAGIGEGAVTAGQNAEQVRQETKDGLLTPGQAALMAGSGAVTGALSGIAGKVAAKLGIGDIDVMLAGGKQVAPTVQKGFVKQLLEGAFSEGVLEELPQSIQEQVAQNHALGKPLDEGVDQAAVLGMLSGMVMGGGAQAVHRQKVPEVGPLSRAANLAAVGVAPTAPDAPTAPTAPVAPVAMPDEGMHERTKQVLLEHANERASVLEEKAKGTKDTTEEGPDGEPVKIAGKQPEFLTPAEKAERDFLKEAGGDVAALGRAYPAYADALNEQHRAQDHEEALRRMERDAKRADSEAAGRSRAAADSEGEGEGIVSGAPTAPEAPTAPVAPTAPTAEEPDLPDPHEDDVLNPAGKPFKERFAAMRRLANLPDKEAYDPVQVNGGYVLRRKGGATPPGSPAAPASSPATPPETQPAGTRGWNADDILNPKGSPFKEKGPAISVQKKTPGSTLVQVPGGWVVRPQPTTLDGTGAAEVQPAGTRGTEAGDVARDNIVTPDADPTYAGDKIDDEWTAFHPSTGTLGRPRADMPQIKAEHRGAMVQFLKARGIAHEQEHDVDPTTLKPTQAEFSPAKVDKALAYEGGDRAILVSSDDHVLDGHHQWVAALADKKPIRVIRLDAPIAKLIDEVAQFPSAEVSDGATPGEPITGGAEATPPEGEATPPEVPTAVDTPVDTPAPPTGDTTGGPSEPAGPKPPKAEPNPPAEPKAPKPELTAGTPLKPADARKAIDGLEGEQKTKFADAEIKALAGVQHAIAKSGDVLNFTRNAESPKKVEVGEGYATPAAEREHIAGNAKAAHAAMARMVAGSDAAGIADALYEGVRAVEPDDLPLVFADDKMIRLPVKLAEREKIEAALKKAKFRISDRAQETSLSERIVLSAIHMPETTSIGDTGRELGGKMKDKGGTTTPPKDADAKAVDAYLDALHPSNFLDPDSNAEQSFGAMMFKEALIDNVRMPLDYITSVLRKQFYYYRGDKDKSVIGGALKDETQRSALEKLAAGYVERLQKLQATLHPAKTVGEVSAAFNTAYIDANERGNLSVPAGSELSRIVRDTGLSLLSDKYAGLFTDDSTDQTHRVKKKDADSPPRLDRIIRIGMKDHRGGKDVTAEEYEAAFGFKGTEFGNWVTQIERQVNLNLAYDSLMDLSDLTGIAPKQIGLAKRLGMALGARGQNNTRAAAHFEPGSNVINLTKTQGNGTVGHEWFHALDHNAAEVQEGGNYTDAARYARIAVNELAGNLQRRWDDGKVDDYLRSLLRQAGGSKSRNTPPKEAVFNAIRHDPKAGRGYRYGMPDGYSFVQNQTQFFSDARAMDEGSEKKYWSSPVELLARGFESFAYDKSKGGSPYLIGPTRADGVVTPKNGYKGATYPTGKERAYVSELYQTFLDQFDGETLAFKPFKVKARIVEVEGLGFTVVDQHGAGLGGEHHLLSFLGTKEEAEGRVVMIDGKDAYLTADRLMVGRVNSKMIDFAQRIEAVMEEMGIVRWPEIKNGTMAESMFFHLRQGWWPENNAALIEYAAKAHHADKSTIDRLKQKYAQEDFEAALGRYAAQRIADMRNEGSDDKAIYDYLVGLYKKQPNLDVQTGVSVGNQAYSTPVPIGFIVGLLTRTKSSSKVFDPTGGNGLLVVNANPKNVVTIELEKRRATNLRLMQYGRVIEGDALKLMGEVRDQEADVLNVNPPFGSLPKSVDVKSWNGTDYQLSKLDHLIAAQSLRAMADGGRATLILGAHKEEGAITSSDRVFLNWLYANYNVADHFEIDGKMYSRQGASWPLRVLVIAGRKQTSTWYPRDFTVRRVFDFDQLWSRYDEARANSEQVLVGAGTQSDQAGSADRDGAGLPAGDGGKAAGPGGAGGDAEGAQDGGVVDGAAGGAPGGNGRPGATGGATAGDGKPGRDGAVGGAVVGGAGIPGGRAGSSGKPGRPDPGGLSDLSDEDIERLISGALDGDKKKAAPKKAGDGTPAGDTAPREPRGPAKPGKSILDGIDGLDGLFDDIDGILNGKGAANDEPSPPDTPPPGGETAAQRRKRLAAERKLFRDKLKAQAPAFESSRPNAFTPNPDALLQLTYTPAPALTGELLNAVGAFQYSRASLGRSIRAALDYQLEQNENPTAPAEKVSSRAMFSRQMEDDAQYARLQPVLAAVWNKLSETISDIGKRIQTFAVGMTQKFGAAIRAFVARFVQDVRDEQSKIPDRKAPIKADAIDNETQVVYRGRSAGDSSGIFVPSKQAAALERAFDLFEAKHGEVDEFVRKEIGYDSNEAMYKALGGYQIDGLALALSSMKDGNGFTIGDDTGVGKGRAAAALIAWAAQNGKVPVFFSFKDDLYSAMYDDLNDIGKGSITLMATNRDALIQSRDGKVILKNSPKLAKEQAQHIIDTGTLPDGAQAILTSYAQVNVPNERREAIARLVREGKAVLIMDEAHNSAGEDSNTNEFFMRLLTGEGLFGSDNDGNTPPPDDWEGPPTAYLSATFAKRPENMPVYVRTHLRHAASTPQELVSMFQGGGDVMQQIASEYLVESGSMIRRERSYAGVNFNYVTDEANAPRDARLVDQVTEVLRQIVYADRAMNEWVKTSEGAEAIAALIPPGSSIAAVASEDRRLDKSLFTSTVHNYIGQLLLATKVSKAVELGIEALNRGEKPVFALQNTMEAALDDFAANEGLTDGDSIPGFGWQSILKRGVTSAQRVTLKSGTGKKANKVRIVVPTNVMPGYLSREFQRAQELIEKFHSTLPGSPIDALRAEMGKYHVVTAADGTTSFTKKPAEGAKSRPLVIREITGREFGVDYSGDVPAYRRRQDPSNLDTILGYQGNYTEKNGRAKTIESNIDALILNSSGSTGISLHASVNAADQRPRHMIVLQPNPDIAVFKQTLGRIHRTGQVEWPFFTVLATGIPAERRLLAVLKKKIGTLFSNTSGGEGSTGVDAVDFINVYGDAITHEYLKDNLDVAIFVGVKLGAEPGQDMALTASGRASLLKVEDQQAYFDTIEERFKQEIEMRDATGTNVLNRRAIDLQAEMVGFSVLEEGLDEDNKFTASAYLYEYLCNVVGDIPDADKVRAAIASSLDGREAKKVVVDLDESLRTAYDEALNQNQLTLAELTAEAAKPETTDKGKIALDERAASLKAAIAGFAARRETTLSNLRSTYPIGAQFDNMKVGDVTSQAVVVGYTLGKATAKKGNPYAPSNITVRFQRNVPSGALGVPLSKLEAGAGEVTVNGRQSSYRDNIDDWFSLRNVSGGREQRYIAGGNLLRARANIKERGEVLLHTLQGSTADAPLIQSGIRMAKGWIPDQTANTDFNLRYPKAGADYVLSVLRALNLDRFQRYGDDEYNDKAQALAAAARFTADFPNVKELGGKMILRGPRDAWNLRTTSDAKLRLNIDKSGAKLAKNTELQAITGTMAKKRGDDSYEQPYGEYVTDPAKIAKLVAILARHTPLVVPEVGAAQAKELQQKHYDADNKDAPPPAVASRSSALSVLSDRRADTLHDLAGAITARWKNAPEIVVARSMADPIIPAAVRSEDAALRGNMEDKNEGEGFFYDGKVYLLADRLTDDKSAVRVLMHESVGHYGMRAVFGSAFGTMLDRMAVLNSGKVRSAAKRLGYDFDKQSERRLAAEEVLAYMAQTGPELGWVRRAVAAIRSWARANLPGFSKLGLSDAELIRDFILPARRWVEGGGNGPKGVNIDTPASFSRGLGAALAAGAERAKDVPLMAGYKVADLLDGAGKLHWWHKTVGMQYHLAQKSAPFKRVYDTVQRFLNDATYYSADAAALAPNILPKLDHLGDALPAMTLFGKKVGKSHLSAGDTKAVSAPVFEGTLTWARDEKGRARPIEEIEADMGAVELDDKAHKLMRAGHIAPEVLRMWQGLPMEQYEKIIEGKFEREFMKPGVVFTPAELKEHFKLDDRQIGLYQETRAALDKSLDDLAVSEMLNYAGSDVADLRDQALELAPSAAAELLRDRLFELAKADPGRAVKLNETGNKMVEIDDHRKDMQARGYAPLSRFGTFTLEATLDTGERYFSLFDTDRERNKAQRLLTAAGATGISAGTMSQEAYKLLNGVSPETAALFGEMLGLDDQGSEERNLAFQTYIKRAVSNRSAMKRLMKRKGIAGFSGDVGRVLANFLFSNGRKTSSNLHSKELSTAVDEVPKEQGQLKDAAVKLADYVRNPQEEAPGFRGILFAQYIGGSVASAMVNATQPFTMTLPYLSQFGGVKSAGQHLFGAVRDATRDTTGDAALDHALKRAEEEGTVSPQEIHALQAQAMGMAQLRAGDGTLSGNVSARLNNLLSKGSLAWGKVFGVAEQFNRRVTFIAAYRTAVEQGKENPDEFAKKAVDETQGVYNKGNKPRWARGAVGSILFTFKQYSVNYVELLQRMATAGEPGSEERKAGQKAALLALAVLFLMAGADGLPFAEDVEDVVDAAMQRMGYNFSSKQQLREFFAGVLGKGGAEFVMGGVSNLPGVPIDFSGRTSMGNLIPGTGLLLKKADHTRDLTELAGAGGDFVKRSFTAADQLASGQPADAVKTILPTAARNAIKASDMASTGMYRDDRGNKVVDASLGEAAGKAIGFQPRSVANISEAGYAAEREKAAYRMESSDINEKWARAKFDGDEAALEAVRDEVSSWNRKNPDQPIKPNMPAILRRVRDMHKSKAQRIADTAPKAIRAKVRADLAEADR